MYIVEFKNASKNSYFCFTLYFNIIFCVQYDTFKIINILSSIMTLTFNENNNQEILSNEEQEIILSKFPEKLKPFLNNCNNPLDENSGTC